MSRHADERSLHDSEVERRQSIWFGFATMSLLAALSVGYYIGHGTWLGISGTLFFVLWSCILAGKLVKE